MNYTNYTSFYTRDMGVRVDMTTTTTSIVYRLNLQHNPLFVN